MLPSVELNVNVAWVAIAAGIVSGSVIGLFFRREDWLGGYASWPRRMLRLGHIAFFGLAILNLLFVNSVDTLGIKSGLGLPSMCLVAANVLMPLVCFLAAWRKGWANLFFLPVGCTLVGVIAFYIGAKP